MDMKQFLIIVIRRGYGIYGKEAIEKMTEEAGISKGEAGINIIGDINRVAKKFFDAYSKITPVAAMNLKMMARMNNIKL